MGAKVREVVVKFTSDQNSLRQLLQDLDLIEQRLNRVGQGAGPAISRPGSNQRGQVSIPSSQAQSGQASMGLGGPPMPPIGNRTGYGAAGNPGGGGSLPQGMNISALAINVSSVSITAQRVVVMDMGGGSSTGGNQQNAAAQAMLANGGSGSGAANLLSNYRLGTVLGGGGSALSAVGGNILNMLMPIAPYAIPAMIGGAVLQGMQSQWVQRAQFQTQLQSIMGGAASSSAPGTALGARLAQQDYLLNGQVTNSPIGPFLGPGGVESVASHIPFAGAIVQYAQAQRQREIEVASASEIYAGRNRGLGYMYGGRAAQRYFNGTQMVDVSDPQAVAAAANSSYAFGQAQSALGGFNGMFGNSQFQQFLRSFGGSQSMTDMSMMPILSGVMGSLDYGLRPGLFNMMRGNNFGGILGSVNQAGVHMALNGDVSGVMGMQSALNYASGSGAFDKILDILQQSLETQKDIRMSSLASNITSSGMRQAETSLSFSRYGGAAPSIGDRSSQTAGAQALYGQAQQRYLDKKRLYDLAVSSGADPEVIRQREAEMNQEREAMQAAHAQAIDITRQSAGDVLWYRGAQIGYGQAQAEYGIAGNQRFGDAGTQAQAQRRRLDMIDQQIDAENEWLENTKDSARTSKETLEHQTTIQNLMTQRASMEFDIAQTEFATRQQVAQARASGASARMGVQYLIGGTAGANLTFGSYVGYQRESIESKKAQLEDMRNRGVSPDNPAYVNLQAQLDSEQAGLTTSFGQPYRPSYGLRADERRLDVYTALVTKTFSQQGDVRGAYYAQMQLGQRQLEEIEADYQKKMRAATTDDERQRVQEGYETSKQQVLMGKILPAYQELESGWQERLISNVYGENSNFQMVGNQFSRREASMLYGIRNRYFGGSKDDMEYYKNQGSLFYQGIYGTQNPEGFVNTGMNASDSDSDAKISGTLEVNVNIKGPNDFFETQRQQANVQGSLSPGINNGPQPQRSFLSG